jgi:hypothetical protein
MSNRRIIGFLILTVIGLPTVVAQTSADDSAALFMTYELPEIVIRSKPKKYSRTNSPAVEIIRRAIEHKDDNRLENRDKYRVEIYEKLVLSIDEFAPEADKNSFVKKFPFLSKYIDTSAFSEKPVVNVSLREKIYSEYHSKEPEVHIRRLTAKRHAGLDKTFDENEALSFNIDELFKGIDVFDNDITILLNRFVSPLSSLLAVYYYEYRIVDTAVVDGRQYVNIDYRPANSRSYGFRGRLQIALDGTWSVARISLTVPENINLNWVDGMRIEQVFNHSPEGTQLMASEDIYARFRPYKGAPPLQAHLSHRFYDYDFESCAPPSDDSLQSVYQDDWRQLRREPLPRQEQNIDSLMIELTANRAYRRMNRILEILISGYIPTRCDRSQSKFDFGPIASTFSSNTLEGARFRLGGMTTARLHSHLFANGYVAYGLKDERLKYRGRMIYSFESRNVHPQERPVHNLSFTHQYDVFIPGGNSLFDDGDNVFNSLKTGIRETQMQYVRTSEIRYEKDFRRNFSIGAWLQHKHSLAAGNLHYLKYQSDGTFVELAGYTTASTGIQLRYAPGEKFYSGRSGKNSTSNMAKDAPIFTLSHQISFRNVAGGDYSFNYTELRAEKRLWLSSFGHIDLVGKIGRIWDKAPFPLLYSPVTNQSFFIQPETFMMMRAMEFVADEYAALHATYFLKGWILNRIPLINRLKLREVASLNVVYGNLSDKNNPAISPTDLFRIPDETRMFGHSPYLEVSVGLDNIFRIVRLDYIYRLNYRNAPNISKSGFRMAFRFSF